MALTLIEYFSPSPLNPELKEQNFNEFEEKIEAESEKVAPKITLEGLDSQHSGLKKVVDLLTELLEHAIEIRGQRQNRGTLKFDQIFDKYSFEQKDISLTKAQASDKNSDKQPNQLTIDLYKLIDAISWAKDKFTQDTRINNTNDLLYGLLQYYITRENLVTREARRERRAEAAREALRPRPRQRQRQTKQQASDQGNSQAEPIQRPVGEIDERDRVALATLSEIKGQIVAKPGTRAPKLVIRHIAKLNTASAHSLAVVLTECIATIDEHYLPALPNRDSANKHCRTALSRVITPAGGDSHNIPHIVLAENDASDTNSHNELVLDLVRLHRYIRDVQAQDTNEPLLKDKVQILETFLNSYCHYYRLQRVEVNSRTLGDEINRAETNDRKAANIALDNPGQGPAPATGAVRKTQQGEAASENRHVRFSDERTRWSIGALSPLQFNPTDLGTPIDIPSGPLESDRTYEEIDKMAHSNQAPPTPPRGFMDKSPERFGFDNTVTHQPLHSPNHWDEAASRQSRREREFHTDTNTARKLSFGAASHFKSTWDRDDHGFRGNTTNSWHNSPDNRDREPRPNPRPDLDHSEWWDHSNIPTRPPKLETRNRTPERSPARSTDPFSPFRSLGPPAPRNFPPRKPNLSIPHYKDAIDAKSFIYDFDTCMTVFECNVPEKIMYLRDALKGSEAQPWLRHYINEKGTNPDWDLLTHAFKTTFSHPSDRKAARTRLQERVMRPDETVRAYIMAKMDLISQFDNNLCEEDRLEYITNGLPVEYQRELISVDHNSVRALTDFLVSFETKLADLRRRIPSFAPEKSRVTIIEPSSTKTEPATVSAVSVQDEILTALKNLAVTVTSNARPSRRDSYDRERNSRGNTPYRSDKSSESYRRDDSRDRRRDYDRRDSSRDRRRDYDRRESSRDRRRDSDRRDSSRDRRDSRQSSNPRDGRRDSDRDRSRDRRRSYDRRESSRDRRRDSDRRDSSRDRRDSRQPSNSRDSKGGHSDPSNSEKEKHRSKDRDSSRDRSKSRDRSDSRRSDSKNGRR